MRPVEAPGWDGETLPVGISAKGTPEREISRADVTGSFWFLNKLMQRKVVFPLFLTSTNMDVGGLFRFGAFPEPEMIRFCVS